LSSQQHVSATPKITKEGEFVDLATLRTLGRAGFEEVAPSRLGDVAAWCKDWCEATGDARYCVLNEALGAIDSWWSWHDERGGVPSLLVSEIERLIKEYILAVVEEHDRLLGVHLAVRFRSEVKEQLLCPGDWVAVGLAQRIGSDRQNVVHNIGLASSSEIGALLVKSGAIEFRMDPFFLFTTGVESPIYVDNRRLLADVSSRRRVVQQLASTVRGLRTHNFDVVAGTATAGIPWGAWVAEALSLPFAYVRGSAKEWGQQRAVEGFAAQGADVLLVEDLIFSASSFLTAARNIRSAGMRVSAGAAIVDYALPRSVDALRQLDVEVSSLVTIDDAITAAVAAGAISDDGVEIVRRWLDGERRRP
jgi:orotate phosphoribosyltransferase